LLFWALTHWNSNFEHATGKNLKESFHVLKDKFVKETQQGKYYLEFDSKAYERGAKVMHGICVTPELMTNARSTLYLLTDLFKIISLKVTDNDGELRNTIDSMVKGSLAWLKEEAQLKIIKDIPPLAALYCSILAEYYETYYSSPNIRKEIIDKINSEFEEKGEWKKRLRKIAKIVGSIISLIAAIVTIVKLYEILKSWGIVS